MLHDIEPRDPTMISVQTQIDKLAARVDALEQWRESRKPVIRQGKPLLVAEDFDDLPTREEADEWEAVHYEGHLPAPDVFAISDTIRERETSIDTLSLAHTIVQRHWPADRAGVVTDAMADAGAMVLCPSIYPHNSYDEAVDIVQEEARQLAVSVIHAALRAERGEDDRGE